MTRRTRKPRTARPATPPVFADIDFGLGMYDEGERLSAEESAARKVERASASSAAALAHATALREGATAEGAKLAASTAAAIALSA